MKPILLRRPLSLGAVQVVVLAATLTQSRAATMSWSVSLAPPPGGPSSVTFASASVPGFDPANGTLTMVDLTYSGVWQSVHGVSNPGSSQSFSFYSSMPISVSVPGMIGSSTRVSGALEGIQLDRFGSTNFSFGGTFSLSGAVSLPSDLSYFVSNDSVRLTASTIRPDISVMPPYPSLIAVTYDFMSAGQAVLTYTYQVPEPATLTLFGGALIVWWLGLRRRRTGVRDE
jgi:hypothetical protein